MTKETYSEILNLSQTIFDDNQYNFVVNCLKSEKFNKLRLFIEEHLNLLDARSELYTNDQILQSQILFCNKLDDIVTDITINNVII